MCHARVRNPRRMAILNLNHPLPLLPPSKKKEQHDRRHIPGNTPRHTRKGIIYARRTVTTVGGNGDARVSSKTNTNNPPTKKAQTPPPTVITVLQHGKHSTTRSGTQTTPNARARRYPLASAINEITRAAATTVANAAATVLSAAATNTAATNTRGRPHNASPRSRSRQE